MFLDPTKNVKQFLKTLGYYIYGYIFLKNTYLISGHLGPL